MAKICDFNKEQLRTFWELVEQDSLSCCDVAKRIGISYYRLKKILAKQSLSFVQIRKDKVNKRVNSIRQDYLNGMKTGELACKYNFHYKTISRIINNYCHYDGDYQDEKDQKTFHGRNKLTPKEIFDIYNRVQAGETPYEIGKEYGCKFRDKSYRTRAIRKACKNAENALKNGRVND